MTGRQQGLYGTPGPPSVWRELTGGVGDRMRQRWAIVRLIPAGGKALAAGSLLVQLVAGVLPIGFVLATADMIARVPAAVDDGVDSADWHALQSSLILAASMFFATQLLVPLQAFLGETLRRRVDDQVRDELMVASFRGGGVAVLEDPQLLDEATDGLNLMRVNNWTPGAACAGLISLVSRYVQTMLAAAVVGVVFAWWAAVAVLVGSLVIRFGYRLGLSAFGRVYRAQARIRRRKTYFRDLLFKSDAAKEIRIFGLLDWVRHQYSTAAMDSVRPVWQARRRIFYGPYVLYTIVSLVLLSVVLAGAAKETALGVGGLVMVVQASLSALRIGGFIAEADVQTEYGMLAHRALRRFGELTNDAAGKGPAAGRASVGVEVARRKPAGLPKQEIRFEKVGFRYGADSPPVLDDLDLRIAAGSSLAIVGLNGAGKTTLVKLLTRLYEPTSGRILIDDIDVRGFPAESWQRQVAAIFQDFVRFELPLRDNVGFGAVELLERGGEADAAIEHVLRRAGAGYLLDRLPRGLDTPLSRQYTDGDDLSGGQWQRVAIARALLAADNGATVMVLDEPTSNLDVRAEVAFFDDFLDLTRGMTTIIISHRFSTVRKADRIVVLEHGKVLESGTHDELLRLGGRYAELFVVQAARFTDPEADKADPRAMSEEDWSWVT